MICCKVLIAGLGCLDRALGLVIAGIPEPMKGFSWVMLEKLFSLGALLKTHVHLQN